MQDEQRPEDVDFVVGGVKVGEYLKKSGRAGNIAMVASIVAAIASVAAVIISVITLYK